MDYVDIRSKFVELSGHIDLIKDTKEDNGADFFLNAGQRYLDRLMDTGKMKARYPLIIHADTLLVYTVGLRAVQSVWLFNATSRYELKRLGLQEFHDNWSWTDITTNRRCEYYVPASFRPFPDTLTTAQVAGMYGIDTLLLDNTHYQYNGVILVPPPSEEFTLEIFGLFYSPKLSATLAGNVWTQTKSYWTEVEPDVLIDAAVYKCHAKYLNTSGAADYKAQIAEDLLGLDHDAVEEDLASGLQMRST